MQVRDGLATDSDGTTTFNSPKTFQISRFTLIFSVAILLCSIVAAGLLILHFGACPGEIAVKTQVCGKDNVIPMITHYGENRTKTTLLNSNSASDDSAEANAGLRLPRSIVPVSYDLKLIPFLFDGNFTFHGEVTIKINITEKCENVTLHAIALNIHENDVRVSLAADPSGGPEQSVDIRRQYFVEQKQFFVIELKEQLKEHHLYHVYIKYTGVLNDLLQGFYRSSYKVHNTTRWVAATQFQPTDARRALPCFDEPALKATFKVTLARPGNMTTLSNMPKFGQSKPVHELPGYFWDEYEESKPMSSYLLAFVVMDFESIGDENFKVWTRADAIQSAKYAAEIGPKILNFYNTFFGVLYPLPKVDMISLPDFTAGAMENWGLITFREAALLYKENATARVNKQRVATVVAHELAHQWFGNLVTPGWWSDLWLNEGFASYMEYVAVDAVESTWKAMDQFVLHEVQSVLTLDALSTSHKIWIEVHNPDEINEIFDRISYGKGATIIRMMEHFLTRQVFREGLSSFLKEKSYKAADQNDLWQHLTEKAHLHDIFDNDTSVKEIMDTWTLQTGFPEIVVTRNYSSKEINLQQQRFVYVDNTNKDRLLGLKSDTPLWWVPISYTTATRIDFTKTRPIQWMRKTPTLRISDYELSTNDWILVNIQQTGYYRVNYDETNWRLLIEYLLDPTKFAIIAPANRAQLIDDALNLARGGRLNYKIALDITKYLAHETDYVPWKAALNALNFLDAMLIKGGQYHKLKRYFLHLIDRVYSEVGFNDPPNTEMLVGYMRTDILMVACHLGLKDCVQSSQREFKKWEAEHNPDVMNPISPNLRSIVYCTAIKYGDQNEWDFAWDRYQKTTVSSEKEILLSAMGCSRETWILMRFLERSLTDEYGIRKHDVFRVFHAVSGNVLGQPIVFHFIRNNWHHLKEYLGSVVANLHSIVNLAARRINTRDELEEFKRFTHQHIKDTSSGRAIQQAIESTESNIEWMDKNYNTIVEWLGNVTYS